MILCTIYLLTAIGLTPGGSITVHIYAQTVRRTTQLTDWEECGPCPIFASYTLAFALKLRKKHGKTSVRLEHGKTSVRVVICADHKIIETTFYKCEILLHKKKNVDDHNNFHRVLDV
jgi:hypothetical protein